MPGKSASSKSSGGSRKSPRKSKSAKRRSSSARSSARGRDPRILLLLGAAIFVAGVTLGLILGLELPGDGVPRPSERVPSETYPTDTDPGEGEPPVVGDTPAVDPDAAAEPGAAAESDPAAESGPAAGVAPKDETTPDRKEGGAAAPIPLYVVIDDVGNNLSQLEAFLETGLPLTFAVLPQRGFSRVSVERISAAGQEAILHLPMEAQGGSDPGAGAILTGLDTGEIEKRLTANLASVPGVIGVNNHMGSKATADMQTMDAVMRYLKGQDLFFLDSRTTARTVGKTIADKYQLSFAERHVFLDNEPNRDYIRQAVEEGMDIARQRGHAVLIGHVMVTEVAEVLEEMYPFVRDEGFDLHHLSDLVLGPKDDGTWD